MKVKYLKLVAMSLIGAAVTLFLDDLRSEEIAEMAAEKAAKKVKEENVTPEPKVHMNRAQRRAAKRGR